MLVQKLIVIKQKKVCQKDRKKEEQENKFDKINIKNRYEIIYSKLKKRLKIKNKRLKKR